MLQEGDRVSESITKSSSHSGARRRASSRLRTPSSSDASTTGGQVSTRLYDTGQTSLDLR